MKRVLVTGGAGFIGSALLPELVASNYDVYVIDNLSFGKRELLNISDDHFFLSDILDRKNLNSIIKNIQPHWVIHLAAIHFIPYCNQNPFEASNINIQGTMNILDALRSLDCLEKVLFASTAAVYPNTNHPIAETVSSSPLDIYGLSKLAGEHLLNEFYLMTKIPSIICRFFNAFGARETNPHLIPEIHRQIMNGKRSIQLGNLDPKRDFIHTADMSQALRLLLEQFSTDIDTFNIGSGQEYSVQEVVEAFELAINEKIQIEVDPARIRKVERQHLCADISKLKEYIGWKPRVDLKSGIKFLIDNPNIALA
ncbi:NAD-dependent epimerase/dehydratase family protein [Acaryochloris marina]|uniref:NDP-sugar dehydratase or epimerase/NAD binding domain 4, putative n=1 Tax=Acaryochloris marina (strain MBIC 11017) TaxID=329726 RepID=B0C3A0_ACAM1|nr:NAD(P)-dependent oxidoreductase [Acaryochloris marina]ABW28599.1 NDP-sugar dehydratase or epimerase/NAD binding domain 4, putative [Acaryochloris marina MBIC11017]BDM77597.1 UDP-glucose 4-epimerase [Acaryochloris marina MBIC10699]